MKVKKKLGEVYFKKKSNWVLYFFIFFKSVLFSCFFTFLLCLALNFYPALIIGQSMEPVISLHDIVFVKKVPKDQIEVGDIIMFSSSEYSLPCTHKVVEIKNGGFVTKGESFDASFDNFDNPIDYSLIHGKVMFVLPHAGKILLFFSNPYNLIYFIVSFPFLYFLCVRLKNRTPDIFPL